MTKGESELKIEVFGRVQGVRFRQFVKNIAENLMAKGYVTNRPDGSVLIIVQGAKNILEKFLTLVQKGSLLSKVDGASYYWRKKTKDYDGFEILIDKKFILDQKSSFINLGKQLIKIGKNNSIPDGNL